MYKYTRISHHLWKCCFDQMCLFVGPALRFTGCLQISPTLCVSCCSRYKRAGGSTTSAARSVWSAAGGATLSPARRATVTEVKERRAHSFLLNNDQFQSAGLSRTVWFPTVVFSSMTSLQKEEFFDLLATSQARRLDDQRAELQNAPPAPPPLLPKAKQRKSSCKVTEVSRTVPTQTPREDFYNMIVNSQVSASEIHMYLSCRQVRLTWPFSNLLMTKI